ncbi:MAG: DNA integrity scanning diadenylate cyclase DisA [Coriobacteriia bacterium]|nr:DNA integrity scanning diadenylate cyclase DisA [Coriobacteriia bacterium]MBS5479177.1 DNA integrity scanning diadenylate cyclase DisA [Coriobacteriia bacterium]
MSNHEVQERIDEAIRLTAPGTALRGALDMILAGHLGALICIGDSESVLASGDDGFPLDIAFTANRLFELSKMDGAIVIDGDLTTIMRANFHLNPDPSLPVSETGMRHRTAARVSMATDAIVISVSQRRQVVNLYVRGRSFQLRGVSELGYEVNQLVVALQTSRNSLDALLSRLTRQEFDNFVTLGDVSRVFGGFQLLLQAAQSLSALVPQLGTNGKLVRMQLEQLAGGMDEEFTLAIRDYASSSSEEEAQRIRREFDALSPRDMASPMRIARILGYDDLDEDSVLTPLGLRTLHLSTAVPNAAVEHIVNEYGSLPALMDDVKRDPEKLGDMGVNNPPVLVDSLYRMWGKKS